MGSRSHQKVKLIPDSIKFILFGLLFFVPAAISAQSVISLSPSNQTATAPNQNITLNLQISQVAGLFGLYFDLAYDTTLFDFVNAIEGSFLSQNGSVSTVQMVSASTPGKIVYGLTRLGLASGGATASAPVTIAQLIFRSKTSAGTSNLTFSNNNLEDTAGVITGTVWNNNSIIARDSTNPVLNITTYADGQAYTANSSSASLGGTASDNWSLSSVRWQNSATGGSGTANGTASWSATVALLSGSNPITITATDTAGNTAVKTLTFSYTAPVTVTPSPPPSGGGGIVTTPDPTPSPTANATPTTSPKTTATTTTAVTDSTATTAVKTTDSLSIILAEAKAESAVMTAKVQLNQTTLAIYDKLVFGDKQYPVFSESKKISIAHFIHYGTVSTIKLGAGERAGVLSSYRQAFGKLPQTEPDWQDVIKIANGRWTKERSVKAESAAKAVFKQIYKRDADLNNNLDENALMVMAYGLRPSNRNLNSEKSAILTFKSVFKRAPTAAADWDAVRATAYSGTKR